MGKLQPQIIRKATALVWALKSKDYWGEILVLWSYVASDIRYIGNPCDCEIVSTPLAVLERGSGDCGEKSVLLAALLESIGHRTRLKAVGFTPDELSHIYIQTLFGDTWVSADPAASRKPLGWQPPGIKNKLIIYNGR